MKCWCRLCRAWVYQEHFLQLKPGYGIRTWDGCGQGRDDIRYHPGNPRCGDIWRVKDGRTFVVDYVDSFCTGITFSDGEQRGCKYTAGYQSWLEREEAVLLSTWDEWPYRFADERGWSPREKPSEYSAAYSVEFMRHRLALKARWAAEEEEAKRLRHEQDPSGRQSCSSGDSSFG